MKVVKLALLGTAALAAVSVSARADNLSDLKAQIEALNARVATLEATPAVPAGYFAVSMSKGQIPVPGGQFKNYAGFDQHIITVMPTADAPEAATTSVAWSGYIKVAAIYRNGPLTTAIGSPIYSDFDLGAKSGLNVTGKTDTAVGEVGVSYSLQANWNSLDSFNGGSAIVGTDGVKGWWKLTPNVTLLGGQFGSLSGNGKGYDGACTCHFTGDGNGGWGVPPADPVQMQLAYADGPLGFAVAVEDSIGGTIASGATAHGAAGFAAEATYAGDMFSAEVNAGYHPANNVAGNQAQWDINAGVGVKLDMFSVSVAGGVGHEGAVTAPGWDFTKVSAFAKANLGDTAHVEFGASEKWAGPGSNFAAGGGIYYDPVKQLTVGLEAAYTQNGINTLGVSPVVGNGSASTTFDLVTIFRF